VRAASAAVPAALEVDMPRDAEHPASLDALRKILAFATAVEIGTGLVLMINPAIVAALLLGVEVSRSGMQSVDASESLCSRCDWRAG
jgi:hypothetical protein